MDEPSIMSELCVALSAQKAEHRRHIDLRVLDERGAIYEVLIQKLGCSSSGEKIAHRKDGE